MIKVSRPLIFKETNLIEAMKKSLKSTLVLSSYLCFVLLFSYCKKSSSPSPVNCSTNAVKVSDAISTWGSNPTIANCEAYKNAVKDFYKSCPTFYTGATKKDLDDFLAEPCQ